MLFTVVLTPAKASENPNGSLRAGAVIDQPVFSKQGQELGELEDLVIKRNGSVKKALISVGGLLEMGEKLISVNYRSLEFADRKIILDTSRKQLENQPDFDYRKHDLFTNYHYRLYPHYMVPGPYLAPGGRYGPHGHTGRLREESRRAPGSGFQPDTEKSQPDDEPYYRRDGEHMYEDMHGMQSWRRSWNRAYYPARMAASVILGQAVVNKQGEEVAAVEDLVINASGKVEKLIFSYGGFLDIGDKLVAVPYRPIGFTHRGITYDITRRDLEKLPEYGNR
jgi:sporulation protein YlmC with PRC-barrel domain